MGLSLWLPVPADVRGDLQKVINQVAKVHGGPVFEPHITLLTKVPPGMSVEDTLIAIRAVVPPQEPLKIVLSRVESGATFFQSVLAAVHPSEHLLALNGAVRKAIAPDATDTYFPHLSLYYGDPPKEKKDAIVQSLYDEGTCMQKADGVEVGGVETFDVTEIWVMDTDKKVEEWSVEGKISLIS